MLRLKCIGVFSADIHTCGKYRHIESVITIAH